MQKQIIAAKIHVGEVLLVQGERHHITRIKHFEQSGKVLISFEDSPDVAYRKHDLVYVCDERPTQTSRKRYRSALEGR